MAALQAAASQLNPVASTVVACHPQRRTTHSRGPLTPRLTARRAHLLNTPSPVVRLGGQGAWQREHPEHHGRRVRMCYQDCEGELVTQSRRSIVQAGAATALLAVLYPLPVLAETGQSEPDQGATKAEKARADMEAWYRVRGDGFAMSVPPSYEDVVEYDESGNSLYGERAKEKPFLARFASPDRKEVLSVVARNGSQLKLSFLQTQDITEFGSLEEAAKIFVPAGSKIVAAATRKPTDSRVPRTYYLYEFLARDGKRVVMSAAAAGGRVFVFGAMAPNSRWKEVGSTMRSAALNFALR